MLSIIKYIILVGTHFFSVVAFAQKIDLEKQLWIHGSLNCGQNKEGGLQVLKYDQTTYIMSEQMPQLRSTFSLPLYWK